MNDLQRKSFELLQIFVGICEKWDIPYFLVCGSALGAVKYQGFVPWDDDIDVGLLRGDYRRFLEVAPGELPDWCFLQNYKSEPGFIHTFSKLRNSNTTFIEAGVAKIPMNHGIYIDIFPLDGHPEGIWKQIHFKLCQKLYSWMRFCVLDHESKPRVRFRNKLFRAMGYHKRLGKTLKKNEALYCAYPPETSELWCNYGNWQGKLEYAPKWHYGSGTWANFEGLRVRIPENFDVYLTQKYGNWRDDLPDKDKKSHHYSIVCDAERPYTEYISILEKNKFT